MNHFESLVGSYCKIVLTQSKSSRGIIQSGFVRSVDNTNKIMILENENGIVKCSFDDITAIRKIRIIESG